MQALLFGGCTLATSDHSTALHALQFAAIHRLVQRLLQHLVQHLVQHLLPFVQATTLLTAAFAAAFSATLSAAFTAICAGNHPFDCSVCCSI